MQAINELGASNPERYGLPYRRRDSVVVGTFNIRKSGDPTKRSPQAFDLIAEHRADLAAGHDSTFDPGVFVDFIRSPHCASFAISPKAPRTTPIEFIAVNAHLLYGTNKLERKREFDAVFEWLVARSRKANRLYAPNYILLGDLNLHFGDTAIMHDQIDARIKALNSTRLTSLDDAPCNFPLLTPHPADGQLHTNARKEQTYDQIGFFSVGDESPAPGENKRAGTGGISAYDYGVFSFVELFAVALYGKRFGELADAERNEMIGGGASMMYRITCRLGLGFRGGEGQNGHRGVPTRSYWRA